MYASTPKKRSICHPRTGRSPSSYASRPFLVGSILRLRSTRTPPARVFAYSVLCVCVFSPCANVSTRHSSVSRHWPLLRATTWHTYASTPWRARCISYGPSCTRARFPAPTDHQDSDPSTTNKYSKAPLKSSTPATTVLLRYPSKLTLANSHSDGTPLS